jgi:putative sterol carrier protein
VSLIDPSIEGLEAWVAGTVQEFFDGLGSRFRSEKAAGLTAVYQFVVTGDGGGEWHADIADGACTVAPGPAETPDITITCAATDWLEIASGRLDSQLAFMTGKLKVKGDMGLAMRLRSLFF